MAEEIINTLQPIQQRIKKIESKPKKVDSILRKGAKQASKLADKNLQEIKHKMGLY